MHTEPVPKRRHLHRLSGRIHLQGKNCEENVFIPLLSMFRFVFMCLFFLHKFGAPWHICTAFFSSLVCYLYFMATFGCSNKHYLETFIVKHISCGDCITLDVCFFAEIFLLLKLQLINISSILYDINLLFN